MVRILMVWAQNIAPGQAQERTYNGHTTTGVAKFFALYKVIS